VPQATCVSALSSGRSLPHFVPEELLQTRSRYTCLQAAESGWVYHSVSIQQNQSCVAWINKYICQTWIMLSGFFC